ncbi:MAG TPA: hypothetical protein VI588_04355, partial [Candidatus Gracilibacteria bacterium]|nr:hypothetical protein [Candidatus Gracilibacteria bacterium]
DSLRRGAEHGRLRMEATHFLQTLLAADGLSGKEKLFAIRCLARFNPEDLVPYLGAEDAMLKAEALSGLWKQGLHRREVQQRLLEMLSSNDMKDFFALAGLPDELPRKRLLSMIRPALESPEERVRLYAQYALIRLHHYEATQGFLHLLLEGNPVIFEEGIELLEACHFALKRRIAKSVRHDHLLSVLKSDDVSNLRLKRLHRIYDVCEANDELEFVRYNAPQLTEATT